MNAPTLLLVAPDSPAAVPPETELLGLPIVRRPALAARRAGFSRVAVAGVSPESPLAHALEGTDVDRLAAGEPAPEGAIVMPWNRVLRTAEVRRIAAGQTAAELGMRPLPKSNDATPSTMSTHAMKRSTTTACSSSVSAMSLSDAPGVAGR